MKTTHSNPGDTEVFATRYSDELYKVAKKFHLNFLKIALPIFVLVAGMDYANFRPLWLDLFWGRLGVIGLIIGAYWMYKKDRLNANWLMVIAVSSIGMHSATVMHFSTMEYLPTMNFALSGFFLAVGIFTLAKFHQTVLISGLIMGWTIAMVSTAPHYSFPDWVNANGFFVVACSLVIIFVSRLRRKLHGGEILARLELEQQRALVDEKNQALEENKQQLEYYNRHLEEEVENRTESLRKASVERDQMVYRLSHDFKSPMVNVKSLSSMAREVSDPEQLKYIFTKIDDSLGLFETLVNDMDNFVTYSREEVYPIDIDLPELIKTTWAVAGKAHPHQMELDMQVPQDLHIHSDSQKVALVLDSIMRNSILFGGNAENGQFKVLAECQERDLVLTLSDNGPGIPEELRDKVFELFYRGDDRSRGLGMGLYLVRATMEQLGGSVTLTSGAEGTTLVLTFPGVLGK